MSKIPRGYGMPREKLADAIRSLAGRIERGERSFELQIPITTISEGLIELRHVEGLTLLNRISLMLLTDDGKRDMRSEYVKNIVKEMQPLDAEKDANALRSLADSLESPQ